MDIEQARFNMIEQQIRTWDVLDQRVLDVLSVVRREEYVPARYRALAFVDMEIPLGHGEVMLAPKVEARMLQELALNASDRVLEIGTGSGYMSALLARCAAHVTSIELQPALHEFGKQNLREHGVGNVGLHIGDGIAGWAQGAPYDAIVLTGSVPRKPQALLEQLKPGGRLFAVVGEAPIMRGTLYTYVSPGVMRSREVFDTVIAPLHDRALKPAFVF